MYVKFSYINSSIALNGEDDEDEDEEDEKEEDGSKENDEGNESILKYFLLSVL